MYLMEEAEPTRDFCFVRVIHICSLMQTKVIKIKYSDERQQEDSIVTISLPEKK